jgi:hypothetical protein
MKPHNLSRAFPLCGLLALAAGCGAPTGHPVSFAPAIGSAAVRDSVRGSLFPDTSANVHLEMVFNSSVRNPSVESGVVDMVWGSSYPSRPAGVYNTAYMAYSVDSGAHTVAWFTRNHPDWLEYRCDRKSLAFQFGDRSNAPLDFTNPAVQAYQWSAYTDPQLRRGYAGIDVDTLSLTNDWRQCGHFDQSGTWVAQFTGHESDAKFRSAILAWTAAADAHVHAQSPAATLQINYSYEFNAPKADNLALMSTSDLVFDERGFTNWGARRNTASLGEWRGIVAAIQYVESKGSCYMTNAEEPGLSKDISEAERQWVIANYLLVKNDCTYMYMSGYNGRAQDYGRLILFPEYAIAIGMATGPMTQQQGVFVRTFSTGLAIVNPTAKAANVTLPAGTYTTTGGQTEGPAVTLGPSSAIVLLTTAT